MVMLFLLVVKIVKWTVITVAYLLVGLAKLVTIVIVLLFLTGRAGIRRLLDAKDRQDDDGEPDEYDLGYPSHVGRIVPTTQGMSRDAFDARWQRERDLRVAERRARRAGTAEARVVTGRTESDYLPSARVRPSGQESRPRRRVTGPGVEPHHPPKAAVFPPPCVTVGLVVATANGPVDHESLDHRRSTVDEGVKVVHP